MTWLDAPTDNGACPQCHGVIVIDRPGSYLCTDCGYSLGACHYDGRPIIGDRDYCEPCRGVNDHSFDDLTPEAMADAQAAVVDGQHPEPDVCGLCGMRKVTPPDTACSTCAG